jgi:glyoxylase-like metal-dependent hydrolase (beta-lactamase superfamily II)
MAPRVDILIRPFTLRFSLHNGNLIYLTSSDVKTQLDGMEVYLGIKPEEKSLLDCNLGFLPTCNTVLIRSDKNILVDPGNFHTGFYGLLKLRLQEFGLKPKDIDIVVNTHSHHDHTQSNFLFRGRRLIIAREELEFAKTLYWPEYVESFFRVLEVEFAEDGQMLAEGVKILTTPGHTPGSISVVVESGEDRIIIVGDTAMTQEEYLHRRLSHWYSEEQVQQINSALDRISELKPTLVIPGHDAPIKLV